MFSHIGPAQSVDNNQTVYTLSPLLSVTPKIYVLNESDLKKYQLPQNYMIVKNPSKNIVTLWEFPNEFPTGQVQQLPATLPAGQSIKTIQEKQKSVDEQKSPPGLGQMTKLLESLGLGSGKEVSIFDLNQLLSGADKK
ncbi:MAG: hypothetical protein NT178_14130 [Proteobacteria bacterium]|nr:hypothetical protein [Pseudomonadota bacterium]